MHDAVLIKLCHGDNSLVKGENAQRMQLLERSAREAGRPVVTISSAAVDLDGIRKHLPCLPVVCGIADFEVILKLGRYLRTLGVTPLVAMDALSVVNKQDRLAVTNEMAASRFHIALTDGVLYLFQLKERYVYAYPKPDVSASVVLVMEPSQRVVLVKRTYDPFKGMYCLPGGFLEPLAETLELCASREFMEEAGVWLPPESLELLTVQSDPGRDPRGHVINHVFFAAVRDDARLELHAGDDAQSVHMVPLKEAMNMPLAADTRSVLVTVEKRLKRNAPLMVSQPFDSVTPVIAEDLRGWSARVRPS